MTQSYAESRLGHGRGARRRARERLVEAIRSLERGDSRHAVQLLRHAIRADPSFMEAIAILAKVCLDLHWHVEFLGGLEDAYAGGNRDVQVLDDLIFSAIDVGAFDKAGRYLDEFQRISPRRRKIRDWPIATVRAVIEACTEDPAPTAQSREDVSNTNRIGPVFQEPDGLEKPTYHQAPVTPEPPHRRPDILERPPLGEIPITFDIDSTNLFDRLAKGEVDEPRRHRICLTAHRLAMVNNLDELLCPSTLHGVEELFYQVETVRKVLRRFRGRALLCDEVGLGKTIEAGMVIKEYLLRGLVRSVLILVPPALVGQWREEMFVKFGLSFVTTSDPLFRADPEGFWGTTPLCIASLAIAKSKQSFARVVAREFDLIVVDEAHHLKNRNTQAWKLLNSIKSRFLLLLTATPLHNNLIELHNLITLLKPGQLATRAAFIEQFVSKADPTRPVNEQKLRELLSDVMIRNTRALAGLRLPPRHATTVRVEPAEAERELYERLSSMVRQEYRRDGDGKGQDRLTLRLLQSEAGSSPLALLKTLQKIRETRPPEDPLAREAEGLATLARSIDSHTKLDALLSILGNGKDQTIVFVSFRETLSFLASGLRRCGIHPLLFHGGISTAEKDAAIAAFQKGTPVLLTTEVGGEGRNLQFCHRMVNFDLPWNPMRIEQRIGRIHRIGQEHESEIWNLCARGSVEDHLIEVLDRKINMFELVVGEIDMILGQMEDGRDFSERVLDAWASASSDEEVALNFERLSDELKKAKAGYERVKNLDETLFGEDYEA